MLSSESYSASSNQCCLFFFLCSQRCGCSFSSCASCSLNTHTHTHWLIDELIALSPANHNDYLRTEHTHTHIYTHTRMARSMFFCINGMLKEWSTNPQVKSVRIKYFNLPSTALTTISMQNNLMYKLNETIIDTIKMTVSWSDPLFIYFTKRIN